MKCRTGPCLRVQSPTVGPVRCHFFFPASLNFCEKTAKKFEIMLDKLFFSAIIVKVAKDSRWFRP